MSFLYPWLALVLAAGVWWMPQHVGFVKGFPAVKALTYRLAICLVGYASVFLTGGHLGQLFHWALAQTSPWSDQVTRWAVGHPSAGLIGVLVAIAIGAIVVLGMLPDSIFDGIKLVPAVPLVAVAVFLLPLVANGIPGTAGDTARAVTEWMRTIGGEVNSGTWAA